MSFDVATANNKSINEQKWSNPPPWERQYGATGVTYEDPGLTSTTVGKVAWKEHNNSAHTKEADYPATYKPMKLHETLPNYGILKGDKRELHILAYQNHNPISHADWMCDIVGTNYQAGFPVRR